MTSRTRTPTPQVLVHWRGEGTWHSPTQHPREPRHPPGHAGARGGERRRGPRRAAGRLRQPRPVLPQFPCLHSEGVNPSTLNCPPRLSWELRCPGRTGPGWWGWGWGWGCWSSAPLKSCVCCGPVKWVVHSHHAHCRSPSRCPPGKPRRATWNSGQPLARYPAALLPTSWRRWLPLAPAMQVTPHHPGPSRT